MLWEKKSLVKCTHQQVYLCLQSRPKISNSHKTAPYSGSMMSLLMNYTWTHFLPVHRKMIISTVGLRAWHMVEFGVPNKYFSWLYNPDNARIWTRNPSKEASRMQMVCFGGQGDRSTVREVSQMDVSHAVLIVIRVRELLLVHFIYF